MSSYRSGPAADRDAEIVEDRISRNAAWLGRLGLQAREIVEYAGRMGFANAPNMPEMVFLPKLRALPGLPEGPRAQYDTVSRVIQLNAGRLGVALPAGPIRINFPDCYPSVDYRSLIRSDLTGTETLVLIPHEYAHDLQFHRFLHQNVFRSVQDIVGIGERYAYFLYSTSVESFADLFRFSFLAGENANAHIVAQNGFMHHIDENDIDMIRRVRATLMEHPEIPYGLDIGTCAIWNNRAPSTVKYKLGCIVALSALVHENFDVAGALKYLARPDKALEAAIEDHQTRTEVADLLTIVVKKVISLKKKMSILAAQQPAGVLRT